MNARHRFTGNVGALCGWTERGVVCSLNYSASLHYNDDDHPLTSSDEVSYDRCGWVLQNVVGGATGTYFCLRLASDPVHRHDEDSASASGAATVRMEYPLMEPPYPDGRVFGSSADAPAEDGVVGEEPWAFTPTTAFPPVAPAVPKEFMEGEYVRVDSPAALAAWGLAAHEEVDAGPWPVRQYLARSTSLSQLMAALTLTGEPFFVSTWWADEERMMARVVWGSLMGLDDEALGAAVGSWTT